MNRMDAYGISWPSVLVLLFALVFVNAGSLYILTRPAPSPVVWDRDIIEVPGEYCPGDTIEYDQGVSALYSGTFVLSYAFRRNEADGRIANVVQLDSRSFSYAEGDRSEFHPVIMLPVVTNFGTQWTPGPHFLQMSMSRSGGGGVPARFRVLFTIGEDCQL